MSLELDVEFIFLLCVFFFDDFEEGAEVRSGGFFFLVFSRGSRGGLGVLGYGYKRLLEVTLRCVRRKIFSFSFSFFLDKGVRRVELDIGV